MEMIEQKVGLTWDCTNGVIASSCTDEIISLAVKSGCIGLNLGVESGNPDILKRMKKPGGIKNFVNAAELLRRYPEVNTRVFLMIGFPGETYRMILDTIKLAEKMNLDWYNITILAPLPNTSIYNLMAEENGGQDVDFREIRYSAGAYGKHRTVGEKFRDLSSTDFKDVFENVELDAPVKKYHLDRIWAYMNYHLNFKRLFNESRPIKLQQQLRYVENIMDLVAPGNAFAMYFCGYLQMKLFGKIEKRIIELLENELKESLQWQARFNEFGLSITHLKKGVFPNSDETSKPIFP